MAGDLEVQRAELMRAQAELEQKVRERTGELERANLTLQRLDEVRRRMFADISHELRTPLTIISGEAEVTLRSRSAGIGDYRTALGRIVDLTGQVARLVEDLMLLARSDAADLQIRRAPVAIEAVLREAAEDLRALADGRQVELALRLPEGASHAVDADPARLVAAAADPGRQRLPLHRGRRPDPGLARGPWPAGRAAGQRQRHRHPAARGGRGVRPLLPRRARAAHGPKGSGLGLHVARTIAEAHDGSLSIDSEPDRGTTVTLTIPLLQPEADGHADPAD